MECTNRAGIGCDENLRDGDRLTISIDGGVTTYQVGDTISVSTICAAPIGLGGMYPSPVRRGFDPSTFKASKSKGQKSAA